MRSASASTDPSTTMDDRTARARIRDAAVARFAEDGVAATSVRAIAADAGVSPALVIHHFGSKDALRVACDQYVATTIREGKQAAMAQGTGLDPLAAVRQGHKGPLLKYLARTLIDGSPHVAELVDEMAADATGYMEQGVQTGVLRPSENPADRAALLTIWSLGALVLHEHVERLLGVKLADTPEELADTGRRYFAAAIEMFVDGLMTEAMGRQLRASLAAADGPAPQAPEEHITPDASASPTQEEEDRG